MSPTRRIFLKQAGAAGALFAFGFSATKRIADLSSCYGTGYYGIAIYGGRRLRGKGALGR